MSQSTVTAPSSQRTRLLATLVVVVASAGTVSTAGGLIFTGDDDGNLVALDASGRDLWHFPTGHTLYASPITYEVGRNQYVTIAATSDIFTFGLFDEK